MKNTFERKLVVRASDLISALKEAETTKGTGIAYLTNTFDGEFFAFYCRDDKDYVSCSDAKESAYYGIGEMQIALTNKQVKILLSLAEILIENYGDKALIVFHEKGEIGFLNSTLEEEIASANKILMELLIGE